MKSIESIAQFYNAYSLTRPNIDIGGQPGHINVFRRSDFTCKDFLASNRRDYYKISLIIGRGVLHYPDKTIVIDRDALLFSNPLVPYSWEAKSENQSGYFCVFSEEFLLSNGSLKKSPLFKIGAVPVLFVEPSVKSFLSSLFERMLEEATSDYPHKRMLLRSYVDIMMHEALKLQPVNMYEKADANARVAARFVDLLERQFPIDSRNDQLRMLKPKDYADALSVHPNHLNRALKQVLGKSVSQLIADRVLLEAKALLAHTDWNIFEIGSALGFQEPAIPFLRNTPEQRQKISGALFDCYNFLFENINPGR
jgi:AraC family transcriptional regulator, transcriptional activator of pobA